MTTSIRALCFLVAVHCTPSLAADPGQPARQPQIDFLYGRDELFPSALVSLTGTSQIAPRDKDQLGDASGVISAHVFAPVNDCTVRVTIAATPFFAESSVSVILPKAGDEYRVAPTIRYNNEKLAAVKQPVPNLVIKMTVVFDSPTVIQHEVYRRVTVRSIHDCVVRFGARGHDAAGAGKGRDLEQSAYLLAAYVNENHPVLDQTITKRALERKEPLVKQFVGYLSRSDFPVIGAELDKRSVRTEVHAIYNSLQSMGFKYVDLGVPPHAMEAATGVETRSVRLVGEIMESQQANELEAATLIASVLRKLSVDTVLLVLPERPVLLGVFLTKGYNWSDLLVLNLRWLGEKPFDEAVRLGGQAYASNLAHFGPSAQKKTPSTVGQSHAKSFFSIDLEDARKGGVLPIPERR